MMQQTTKVMFARYLATNYALDVMWMRKRRLTILYGDFDYAVIKPYHIYSSDPTDILSRQLDYPSPLFDEARKHQWRIRQSVWQERARE